MIGLICIFFLSTGVTNGYNGGEIEVPATNIPQILSQSMQLDATIGENVTFPCEVHDLGDYVLIWRRAKLIILYASSMQVLKDSRISLNGTSLMIRNVQPSDSMDYSCQISVQSSTPLVLTHTLNVLYPPTVKPHPSTGLVRAKEGESVTLVCTAKGNPAPTITWRHKNRDYRKDEGNNFMINSAQKGDSGEYECIASNDIGEPAVAVITVEVVSAPKVSPFPENGLVVVKEGEPIAISCDATGDPRPVMHWKKPRGTTRNVEGNKIFIEKAERADAGSYECIANNSLGISTSALIRVQVMYKPEVTATHSWIHSGEGNNVNISCNVMGEPAPSVMWKRGDGQILQSGSHFSMRAAGHLHWLEIHRLQERDFGRYECEASNSLSSASDSVHIIGTPQVPIFTSKPHGSQATKYTISWTVDSHTPVDEYSLMFRKKSSDSEWESRTIPATEKRDSVAQMQAFQLLKLEPETSYEAVVTARNKFGWSKQSEAIVFTTKKEDKYSAHASSASLQLFSLLTILPAAFIQIHRYIF